MCGMGEQDELLLLRSILRAADYGVLLSNRERRDLVCNRCFCELFGIDEQAVIHLPPEEVRALVLPRLKSPDEFVAVLDAVYADPDLVREDEIEISSPRRLLLRRYTAPVRGDDGELIGRLWTFLDITQTRNLERKVQHQAEQLRVQSRQLASALKAVSGRLHKVETTLSLAQQQLFESEKLSVVGMLAASVAHDIRNILTPMMIELSLADQQAAEARRESLQRVRLQIDRLSLLTRRLLAMTRPATRERVSVDLKNITEHIILLLRPQAALDGVEVITHFPSRLTPIAGDPVQIEQVLVNLVLNGVQSMQEKGGVLTVILRRQRRQGREGIVTQVRDSGPGIPLPDRKRLFDPFFTTKPDGAGLGLFSCRRIAEEHDGCIRIRTRVGCGTQVSFWLPAEISGSPER
jgi:signal transduction histidine kinase